MILSPLCKEKLSEEQMKVVKVNSDRIKGILDEMKYGCEISFEEFIDKLKLNEDEYITAIRLSLNRDTLFLRRSPSEIRVNSYNTTLLRIWQANTDVQYVLDPYACVVYILSYITKGQRGMSACEEVKHKLWS